MRRPRGRPIKVDQGTLPSPADPYPSNQTRKTYRDGTVVIHTPRPTAAVLAEYTEAVEAAPEDAGLRLHYGLALKHADRADEALAQVREAKRLAPEWDFPHSILAALLLEAGEVQAAIAEEREALRLVLRVREQGQEPGQGETLARWGLAKALLQSGESDQARAELEQAVHLQRELLSQGRASQQLLRQLEEALAGCG
jgi:tetratricopeptide (TPR) repeat protein